MKNLFAVIGLVVVTPKAYELYREFVELRRGKGKSQ